MTTTLPRHTPSPSEIQHTAACKAAGDAFVPFYAIAKETGKDAIVVDSRDSDTTSHGLVEALGGSTLRYTSFIAKRDADGNAESVWVTSYDGYCPDSVALYTLGAARAKYREMLERGAKVYAYPSTWIMVDRFKGYRHGGR